MILVLPIQDDPSNAIQTIGNFDESLDNTRDIWYDFYMDNNSHLFDLIEEWTGLVLAESVRNYTPGSPITLAGLETAMDMASVTFTDLTEDNLYSWITAILDAD